MIRYRQPRNMSEMNEFVRIVEETIDSGESGQEIISRSYKRSIILAIDEGLVVGGISFLNHKEYEKAWDFSPEDLGKAKVKPSTLGYISYIAVAPSHQGLGIGVELLKKASVRLESRGCGAFWTHVWSGSPGNASFRLFSSQGFEQVKRTKKPWAKSSNVKCVICGEHCQCDCLTMLKKT